MMGSMMKGEKDVLTLKVEGSGPVGMYLATANSHGKVKGYAANPGVVLPANSAGKLDVAGSIGVGLLTVTRDIGLKEPYSGTCELISGEIAEDITYYFASSEQTPSSVGLGVLMTKENTVDAAGGFIIQVMPVDIKWSSRQHGSDLVRHQKEFDDLYNKSKLNKYRCTFYSYDMCINEVERRLNNVETK